MSNLMFKNPFEMSHDELLAYVADLEKRIANANNGAAIFRGEANLNRTEMLKYKEIAGQADDRNIDMKLTFERHLAELYAVAQNCYEAASEPGDFISYVRLLRQMLMVTLSNFRREYLGERDEIPEFEDLSDIPF